MTPWRLAILLTGSALIISLVIRVLVRASRSEDPGRVSSRWLSRQSDDEGRGH